jgi:aminomethyltransferase
VEEANMTLVRATPFHARTSQDNRLNAWSNRNGWTLPSHYGDPAAEALAARTTVVLSDISWRWRVKIAGARAEEFLARLLTRNPAALSPGTAFKALWLTDRGGVRGAGAIARYGGDSFRLIAARSDPDWIRRAAALFDVEVHDEAGEAGGLAIVGPFGRALMETLGLDAAIEPLASRRMVWRGLDVELTRYGEHGGYELWCCADDAPILWNRILRAGEDFALKPAGLEAMDILDLEAGIPRPGRDYTPAADGRSHSPAVRELGLEGLVDADHPDFNGRAAFLSAPSGLTRAGMVFDDGGPAPHAPLFHGALPAGRTMSSLYSPALRRTIALASVKADLAAPGTNLTVRGRNARVNALPFLPTPEAVDP